MSDAWSVHAPYWQSPNHASQLVIDKTRASCGLVPPRPAQERIESMPDALPILRLILHEERRNNFNFFTNTYGLRIERSAGLRPIMHASRIVQNFTISRKKPDGRVVTRAIVTRWKSINGEPELDIETPGTTEWICIPARSWLTKEYGGETADRGLLDEWFERYHKSFQFLNLPSELRSMVFEVSIGPVLWPDHRASEASAIPQDDGRCTDGAAPALQHDLKDTPLHASSEEAETVVDTWPRGMSLDAPRLRDKVSCYHPLSSRPYGSTREATHWIKNMLLVSKAFSSEAQKTIWESTNKRFGNIATLTRTIPHLKPIPFNALRRISLTFSDRGYLRLLGYKTMGDLAFTPLPAEKSNSLRALTDIESIDDLDLHFQASLPFRVFGDRLHPVTQFKPDPFVIPCQKKWIEWFLTLLYERFTETYTNNRNVPMVSIKGDVKYSTRLEWEPIWREFKHGVRRDFAEKAAEIKSTPAAQFPPICSCESPCAWVEAVQPNPDCGCEVVAEFDCRD